jgi:acyl-CoA dehydrogenase
VKPHPALTEEHEAFRDTVRRFVARELLPHATAWDEAGEFPRELYRKTAQAGLLGGAGFIRGTRAERIYREAKVMQIGGRSTEIMKDLTARQLGW